MFLWLTKLGAWLHSFYVDVMRVYEEIIPHFYLIDSCRNYWRICLRGYWRAAVNLLVLIGAWADWDWRDIKI